MRKEKEGYIPIDVLTISTYCVLVEVKLTSNRS